jgi:predicted transcriptional regulator of viral defense system
MTDTSLSQTRKTFGRAAAPVVEALEARGATVVTAAEIAAIKGVPAGSPALRSLIRRLKANGWLVPMAARSTYEFVPLRVGRFASGDELRELEALAREPNAPRFQIALRSAAFLRGYADTAPTATYVLMSKRASRRPPGLHRRFRVIRTDPRRLFGAEPLSAESRVAVSTAARLFIDVALYWWEAGDLRARDHWLAAAAPDATARDAATWARALGPSVVSRVGFLADRFGARSLARLLEPQVARRAVASFGPRGQGVYDERWHVYDPIGIARS